jgi:ATP:corrinoid adenosyltransferase
VGPKPTKQTKSRKEQILIMKKENDQSRKIFSLWPYHPKCAQPHLVSEAKSGSGLISTWMGNKSSKETAQRQTVWRQVGNAIKVQMESFVPDLSKITKAKRIEEVVLIHMWSRGIKALPDTNSYF